MARPRVTFLSGGGHDDWLGRQLDTEFDLTTIVKYRPETSRRRTTDLWPLLRSPHGAARHLLARLAITRERRRMRDEISSLLASPPPRPPDLVVADINDARVAAAVRRSAPDLVVVHGTNLLRGDLLSLSAEVSLGMINLHTGLSPYTRGGNCNLWALIEERPEWVGVTVHHLDAGIDSGDIVLSDQVPMRSRESFEVIEARAYRHGYDLLLRAARLLAAGRATRVTQWEAGGKLYLRRTGYLYEPRHRAALNSRLRRGWIDGYLADRAQRDAGVRRIGVEP